LAAVVTGLVRSPADMFAPNNLKLLYAEELTVSLKVCHFLITYKVIKSVCPLQFKDLSLNPENRQSQIHLQALIIYRIGQIGEPDYSIISKISVNLYPV